MRETLSEVEYVQPDPRLRRAALWLVLGGGCLGVVVIGWGLPWAQSALLAANARGNSHFPLVCYVFLGLVALLALPVIWFGVYAVRFGSQVLATGQYPPPGIRVLRRTPVLRGPLLRYLARGQQVLGVALVLCGIALLVLVGWGWVLMVG